MTTRAAAERVPIHTAIEAGQPAPTTTPGDPRRSADDADAALDRPVIVADASTARSPPTRGLLAFMTPRGELTMRS